jgi:adenine/guanine phosphoribosyltransferase-like PRPP-binding protein
MKKSQKRTPWDSDFPRVVFSSALGSAEKHKDYTSAKGGDILAAIKLVDDLVSDDAIKRIEAMLDGKKPYIAPVLAIEATGNNMIPTAYAYKIASVLGIDVVLDVVQSEKVGRTGKGSDYRLAYSPLFDGVVKAGYYLIIDDTMTMGGTLASLKGHIENNGGKVVGATTLTGFGENGVLALSNKMRDQLWEKHGKELDDYLKEQFGYGIDCLTQGEAGHYRKANSIDEIRNRITEARNEKSR